MQQSTQVPPAPSLPPTHSPRSLRHTSSTRALNTRVSPPPAALWKAQGILVHLRKLKSHLQTTIEEQTLEKCLLMTGGTERHHEYCLQTCLNPRDPTQPTMPMTCHATGNTGNQYFTSIKAYFLILNVYSTHHNVAWHIKI